MVANVVRKQESKKNVFSPCLAMNALRTDLQMFQRVGNTNPEHNMEAPIQQGALQAFPGDSWWGQLQ